MTNRPIPAEAPAAHAPDSEPPAWDRPLMVAAWECDCPRGACPRCCPEENRAFSLDPPDGGLLLHPAGDVLDHELPFDLEHEEACDRGYAEGMAQLRAEDAAEAERRAADHEAIYEDRRKAAWTRRVKSTDRSVIPLSPAFRALGVSDGSLYKRFNDYCKGTK